MDPEEWAILDSNRCRIPGDLRGFSGPEVKPEAFSIVDELEAWFAERSIGHDEAIGIVDALRDRLAGLKLK